MPWFILIILLSFDTAAATTKLVTLNSELELPLPMGWTASKINGDYPYQLLNDQLSAEILVFKSPLTGDNVIGDADELRQAVANVAENVILSLPEARLQTSTGYADGNRARFVIEFVSFDSASGLELWHRLAGYIYRHPNGSQLLFTVWGKCRQDNWTAAFDGISQVQDNFTYSGPAESLVFASSSGRVWWSLGALFLVLISVYLVGKRYRRYGRITFSEDAGFWRCRCGRLNHVSVVRCRRCGGTREQKTST